MTTRLRRLRRMAAKLVLSGNALRQFRTTRLNTEMWMRYPTR